MAILSASAKFYTGSKLFCVDKNISAALTSSFSLGNQNQPYPTLVNGVATIFANVLVKKQPIIRAGIRTSASVTAQGGFSIYGGAAAMQSTSTLRCKFPTYVKLDWEKLGLPEATNVVLQVEEGFVQEGDYSETNNAPIPKNLNLFSFRTPTNYKVIYNSQFALTNVITKLKPLVSSLVSAASIVAKITYNPGRFAALEMSNFTVVPTAAKTVRGLAGLFQQRSDDLITVNSIRVRFVTSNFVQSAATLITNNAIVRLGIATMSSSSAFTADGLRTAILVPSAITANTSINTAPVKTARGQSNITASASMSINAVSTRSMASSITATSSISAPLFDITFTMQTDLVSTDYKNLAYTPNTTVTIPMLPRGINPGYSINAIVNWGDGTSNTYTNTNQTITHTYSQHGTYDISIGVTSGSEYFRLGATDLPPVLGSWTISDTWYNKIKTFRSWGLRNITPFINSATGSAASDFIFIGLFARTAYTGLQVPSNLPYVDRAGSWQNKPDLKLQSMFEDSKANPSGVTTWNLAGFRSVYCTRMFKNAKSFNQPIGNWNTTRFDRNSYTDILANAELFNQSLGNWTFPSSYTDGTNNMSPFNNSSNNSFDIDFSEKGDFSEENWNRTIVGWAQWLSANAGSSGIGYIRRPAGADNTVTVYASGAYGDGEAAYYYLDVIEAWTFLGYGT